MSDTGFAAGGIQDQNQAQVQPQTGQGQGDALDKGVDFLERKEGHEMVRIIRWWFADLG